MINTKSNSYPEKITLYFITFVGERNKFETKIEFFFLQFAVLKDGTTILHTVQ